MNNNENIVFTVVMAPFAFNEEEEFDVNSTTNTNTNTDVLVFEVISNPKIDLSTFSLNEENIAFASLRKTEWVVSKALNKTAHLQRLEIRKEQFEKARRFIEYKEQQKQLLGFESDMFELQYNFNAMEKNSKTSFNAWLSFLKAVEQDLGRPVTLQEWDMYNNIYRIQHIENSGFDECLSKREFRSRKRAELGRKLTKEEKAVENERFVSVIKQYIPEFSGSHKDLGFGTMRGIMKHIPESERTFVGELDMRKQFADARKTAGKYYEFKEKAFKEALETLDTNSPKLSPKKPISSYNPSLNSTTSLTGKKQLSSVLNKTYSIEIGRSIDNELLIEGSNLYVKTNDYKCLGAHVLGTVAIIIANVAASVLVAHVAEHSLLLTGPGFDIAVGLSCGVIWFGALIEGFFFNATILEVELDYTSIVDKLSRFADRSKGRYYYVSDNDYDAMER